MASSYSLPPFALSLGSVPLLSRAQSRSISPENLAGEKGKGGMAPPAKPDGPARELGLGWKTSPFIRVEPGETRELGRADGPGVIQQIWMTPTGHWRHSIRRIYWEDAEQASVECPIEPPPCSGRTRSRFPTSSNWRPSMPRSSPCPAKRSIYPARLRPQSRLEQTMALQRTQHLWLGCRPH